MRNSVTVQIYTGGFGSAPERFDMPAIKDKLLRICKTADVACVMIGWNPDARISAIMDLLRGMGIEAHLWLPVFSGWDGLSPLVGRHGGPVRQDYRAENGERFDFGCPADPQNVRFIERVFETFFSASRYDGVFLDKIRFPGFMSGLQTVLTCFCPYCSELHGISEDLDFSEGDNPLHLTAYEGLRYKTGNPGVSRLFDYKAKAVTESVASLSGYFRSRGLKVGLDLFAPFLSHFVGQDYGGLAPYADYIKPMFYRKTNAPAGIPFELDVYANAFGGGPDAAAKRKGFLLNMLKADVVDSGLIGREISAIRENAGCAKLYAGVEINYNEKIAPVTARYIQESIDVMRSADGVALSWDLCSTPDENLDAALECL